jgi:hypothetical protein
MSRCGTLARSGWQWQADDGDFWAGNGCFQVVGMVRTPYVSGAVSSKALFVCQWVTTPTTFMRSIRGHVHVACRLLPWTNIWHQSWDARSIPFSSTSTYLTRDHTTRYTTRAAESSEQTDQHSDFWSRGQGPDRAAPAQAGRLLAEAPAPYPLRPATSRESPRAWSATARPAHVVGTTTGRGSMHLRPSVVDHPGPGAWGAAGKVKAGHVKRLFFQRNRASPPARGGDAFLEASRIRSFLGPARPARRRPSPLVARGAGTGQDQCAWAGRPLTRRCRGSKQSLVTCELGLFLLLLCFHGKGSTS